jgi:hypothetical protein
MPVALALVKPFCRDILYAIRHAAAFAPPLSARASIRRKLAASRAKHFMNFGGSRLAFFWLW